ncbi:TerB family tellurite resistance protein [Aquamicrobium segne]|uniref:TerB family tellurite resistance protein n=1 Tax=Aquamicrobium segne TaxID=469547 RepID=A0ABW0GTX1_9HYPH
MIERFLSFLKTLPGTPDRHDHHDDPRVAASALLYHVMNVDGERQDVEWERFKAILSKSYAVSGKELDELVQAGAEAERESVDFYAFTSVLNRHLDHEGRKAFIELMWEIVFADGELHELEDNTVWRVAELLDVEREDRIAARRKVAARLSDIKKP